MGLHNNVTLPVSGTHCNTSSRQKETVEWYHVIVRDVMPWSAVKSKLPDQERIIKVKSRDLPNPTKTNRIHHLAVTIISTNLNHGMLVCTCSVNVVGEK